MQSTLDRSLYFFVCLFSQNVQCLPAELGGKCPTSFAAPITLAATFNMKLNGRGDNKSNVEVYLSQIRSEAYVNLGMKDKASATQKKINALEQ